MQDNAAGTRKERKRHPLLLLLDVIIALLTVALAVSVIAVVADKMESKKWRLSPSNYSDYVRSGNYLSLSRSFYGNYNSLSEDEITPELEPYRAVADYYRDSFRIVIYRGMGDEARVNETEAALSADRTAMGVFAPEADKIDKIFDIHR